MYGKNEIKSYQFVNLDNDFLLNTLCKYFVMKSNHSIKHFLVIFLIYVRGSTTFLTSGYKKYEGMLCGNEKYDLFQRL